MEEVNVNVNSRYLETGLIKFDIFRLTWGVDHMIQLDIV